VQIKKKEKVDVLLFNLCFSDQVQGRNPVLVLPDRLNLAPDQRAKNPKTDPSFSPFDFSKKWLFSLGAQRINDVSSFFLVFGLNSVVPFFLSSRTFQK